MAMNVRNPGYFPVCEMVPCIRQWTMFPSLSFRKEAATEAKLYPVSMGSRVFDHAVFWEN